ncbi:MAG: hypothetical protein WCK58_06725, partial [Chloroflexota bacterium]
INARVSAKNVVSLPGVLTAADSITTAQVVANPSQLPGAITFNNPTVIFSTGSAGTPFPGDHLIAGPNTVNPTPTSYAYEWFRCDTGGANCVSQGAPQAGSYTIQSSDVGGTIAARTYATNQYGTAVSGIGAVTSEVLPLQVTQTSVPVIYGKPWLGHAMTAAVGSYSGAVQYAGITWQYCDMAFAANVNGGSHCSSVVDSSTTYPEQFTPNVVQKGSYLRLAVLIDVNGLFQAPASLLTWSATTAVVTTAPAKVANTKAPSLTGTAQVGKTLTIGIGSWTGSPTYTYAWYRCNATGSTCTRIAGAKAKTYVLAGADTAWKIKAVVAARNLLPSSAVKATPLVGLVKGKPWYASGAKITGTATVGQTLKVAKGTWQAYPSATFTYRWYRNGVAITGATALSYKLTAKDKGKSITVKITGKNSLGSTSKTTAPVVIS